MYGKVVHQTKDKKFSITKKIITFQNRKLNYVSFHNTKYFFSQPSDLYLPLRTGFWNSMSSFIKLHSVPLHYYT